MPPLKKELLREARLRKRMSQLEVQQACAERGLVIGQYQLSKLETGAIRWPPLKTLEVLADVLGLEYDDLFEEEKPAGAKEAPSQEPPQAKGAAALWRRPCATQSSPAAPASWSSTRSTPS
jgi:transcriptional regulator with XRE-family HTH domain